MYAMIDYFMNSNCSSFLILFKYLQATDDEGSGTSTVVPLKITLSDSNDNPPVFSSEEYKAIIDEGSAKFEPPLQVLVCIINIITYKY